MQKPPTNSTYSTNPTPTINRKALSSITRVGCDRYVGLICNLSPPLFPRYRPSSTLYLPEIYMVFDKDPRWVTPRVVRVICYGLQASNLWRTETSVTRWAWIGWIARQGVERGRCDGSYNDFDESRTHSGRDGTTPVNPESAKAIDINEYRWQKHCRGLFHLPIAA